MVVGLDVYDPTCPLPPPPPPPPPIAYYLVVHHSCVDCGTFIIAD